MIILTISGSATLNAAVMRVKFPPVYTVNSGQLKPVLLKIASLFNAEKTITLFPEHYVSTPNPRSWNITTLPNGDQSATITLINNRPM